MKHQEPLPFPSHGTERVTPLQQQSPGPHPTQGHTVGKAAGSSARTTGREHRGTWSPPWCGEGPWPAKRMREHPSPLLGEARAPGDPPVSCVCQHLGVTFFLLPPCARGRQASESKLCHTRKKNAAPFKKIKITPAPPIPCMPPSPCLDTHTACGAEKVPSSLSCAPSLEPAGRMTTQVSQSLKVLLASTQERTWHMICLHKVQKQAKRSRAASS